MGRRRGSWSLLPAVLAAAQLSYIPAGRAQDATPQVAPEAQAPDSNVAPPPPVSPEKPSAPPPGPVVTLRADSPRARLQVQTQLQWQDVCMPPCNRPVNPAGVYRVGGGSIRASDSFNMPRTSGPVVVEAQVGSKVKHWVGVAMMIVGAIDIAGGIAYYAAADDLADATSGSSGLGRDYYRGVGIGGMIVGVVLLAIGIPLSFSSTSVEVR